MQQKIYEFFSTLEPCFLLHLAASFYFYTYRSWVVCDDEIVLFQRCSRI